MKLSLSEQLPSRCMTNHKRQEPAQCVELSGVSDPVVRYIGPSMLLPLFPFENLELEHILESSSVHPVSSPLTVSLSLRLSMNTDRLSNGIPLRRWARVRNISSEETPALKRSVFLGCCLPKIGYFLVLPQYWLTWTFEISILLPSIASRLTITTVKSPPLKFAIAQLQKPSPPTTKFYRGAESTRARWRQDL
ncbi:uncharacterized protein BT62DRAFT_1012739 [Guyanagaster necrorhizus]|uniref:Uncharacterized protein n=1 Tax=Guyanagaster necrorhizus TaxID=856835 RepID=A0A9P7VGY6_9AGAR|nr:uncharacterized protein BT62DRAFT_1012739 [Guyanagaster necrorhizus MCA 3950]KAG7440378.1 hypothetical protein BT62DRAFT_1012739 [Guyanagaster necrorhizus MCA 3950]